MYQPLVPAPEAASQVVSLNVVKLLPNPASSPQFVTSCARFIEAFLPGDEVVEFCTSVRDWRAGAGCSGCQINCLLASFYGHNTAVRDDKDQFMLFPQLSTVQTTANSSSYLFWGFRELGRMVGSNLKVNSAGRIELRVEEQCKQVAHPLAKKGHNRRWIVEVAHSWFTRFRKLLVRYEKLDRSFLVFNHLAIAISSEATPFRGTIVAAST